MQKNSNYHNQCKAYLAGRGLDPTTVWRTIFGSKQVCDKLSDSIAPPQRSILLGSTMLHLIFLTTSQESVSN